MGKKENRSKLQSSNLIPKNPNPQLPPTTLNSRPTLYPIPVVQQQRNSVLIIKVARITKTPFIETKNIGSTITGFGIERERIQQEKKK
jgi:hypothetical protein